MHSVKFSFSLSALLLAAACGGAATSEIDGAANEAAAPHLDPPAHENPASAPPHPTHALPSTTSDPSGEHSPEPAQDGDTGRFSEKDQTEDSAEAPPIDPTIVLIEEVKNRKTTDDRAIEALNEARSAGADVRSLAKAANRRGEKMAAETERATRFFEWARAADPKYPNASFNLARLAANAGEIEAAKALLHEVKKRGGKRLLKNVGFDPTFALIAEDPDVRALIN